MCRPNNVSVWAPAACRSADRIDGSASEWQYTSHGATAGICATGRLAVRRLQLGVALVDVERAGERLLRAHRRIAQARQPVQQHVDLELGALRWRIRRGRSDQPVEDVRGDVGEHLPRRDRAAVGGDHAGRLAVGAHGDDLGAGDQLGPPLLGGRAPAVPTPCPSRRRARPSAPCRHRRRGTGSSGWRADRGRG